MIRNSSPDKSVNPESLKKIIAIVQKLFNQCAHSSQGFADGAQKVLFTVLWFKWSVKKNCVPKVLLAIWDIFLHENNRNYNSYRFSYELALIVLLSFLTNQKQESGFRQVGGLVTRNISVFYL